MEVMCMARSGVNVQDSCALQADPSPLVSKLASSIATGDQWRSNSRKNEETEPKQKQPPVVDVTGDGSKGQCCKNNIA